MTYEVRFSPRGASQIRRAATWWVEHRPAAPDAFVQELDRVLARIAAQPESGQPVSDPKQLGVRRVLLRRIHYYLYYAPAHEEQIVVVLALWHSARGTGPKL